jgi:hypothetical protein
MGDKIQPPSGAAQGRETSMSGASVGTEDVTAEEVLAVLSAAYLDASMDGDGDVLYRGAFRMYLIKPTVGYVRFISLWTLDQDRPLADRIAFANRFNDIFKLVRATIGKDGDLELDYFFPVLGGLSGRALVETLRRFESIVADMGKIDSDHVLG